MLLGAHFSISGGLHKAFDHADKYNCTAMQIFTQNSHTWKIRELTDKDIQHFHDRKKDSGVINVTAHTGYLINLAGADPEKAEKSMAAMRGELIRAEQLGIEGLVLHPGSFTGSTYGEGILRLTERINTLLDETPESPVRILFETTAGQGNSIGHKLEDIETIIDKIEDKQRTGLCLDTCHLFAAGYDISTESGYTDLFSGITDKFGPDKIGCIHLNDSKKPVGSKVDRHEHIGDGFIGEDAFRKIMTDPNLAGVPKVIELPDDKDGIDMTARNLERLHSYNK